MKIFSGTSNRPLAVKICEHLNIPIGEIYLHTFPSQEKYCQYKENIRGEDVFLIQSGSNPVNDNLMELLIMCDAARRASAKKITVVIPYFGYSRQERKDKPRVPISAKLVMDMIACAGAKRYVTLDLHAAQIQGFTNLPVDQLSFKPALIEILKNEKIDCIVAPDIGAVKRGEEYADALGIDLVVISKKRKNETSVELQQFIGDVTDKNVIIIDDMTESGGTLIQAATACKVNKAKKVFCAVTHGCISTIGYDKLNTAMGIMGGTVVIDKFFISNSVDNTGLYFPETYLCKNNKIVIVDISPWFAKAIHNIATDESVSELFK